MPVFNLPVEEQRLRGFNWRGEERPQNRFVVTDRIIKESQRDEIQSTVFPDYPFAKVYFAQTRDSIMLYKAQSDSLRLAKAQAAKVEDPHSNGSDAYVPSNAAPSNVAPTNAATTCLAYEGDDENPADEAAKLEDDGDRKKVKKQQRALRKELKAKAKKLKREERKLRLEQKKLNKLKKFKKFKKFKKLKELKEREKKQ